MAGEAIRGIASTVAMIDALPVAARYELADLLGKIGRDVLAAQQAAAPVGATGNLRAGLTMQLLTDQLKVRVGLLGIAAVSKSALRRAQRSGGDPRNLGDLYYGRFVEFGRKAQNAPSRRKPGTSRSAVRRRLRGLLKGYVTVAPAAARPFVELPDADVDTAVDGRLDAFWDKLLSDAGAGA